MPISQTWIIPEFKLYKTHFILRIFVAMKPHEIQEKLGLTRIRDRNWYVQPACASTGDGLYEGLTWLTSNHKSWSRWARDRFIEEKVSWNNIILRPFWRGVVLEDLSLWKIEIW